MEAEDIYLKMEDSEGNVELSDDEEAQVVNKVGGIETKVHGKEEVKLEVEETTICQYCFQIGR